MQNNKINWKDREHLAVFVDILGISKKYENAGNDIQKLTEIAEIFHTLHEKSHEEWNSELAPEWGTCITFSDSSYSRVEKSSVRLGDGNATDYERYGFLLSCIGDLQSNLVINHGIFIRGGCAKGMRVYGCSKKYKEDASYAYYRAYSIESKEACIPLVVLDEELANSISKLQGHEYFGQDINASLIRKWKLKNGKEYFFIDYLKSFIEDNFSEHSPEEIMERHKSRIISAYNSTSNDNARYKYSALAHYYHNEIVEEMDIPKSFSICCNEIPCPKSFNVSKVLEIE